jgi:hypothetical protein
VPVYVADAGTLDPETLLDAKIDLQGVLSYRFDMVENTYEPALWVASHRQIRLMDAPGVSIAQVPSLRALVLDPQWVARGRRVKVLATVAEIESDHVLVARADGTTLAIETADAAKFSPGEFIIHRGFGLAGATPGNDQIVSCHAEANCLPAAECAVRRNPAAADIDPRHSCVAQCGCGPWLPG